MGIEIPIEEKNDQHESKNLIRSEYKDIMIKVDEDIYYLHRLQLALKSEYFEKLFIDDFSERNSDLIQLPMIDSDTFSAAVDIMYGNNLKCVVNSDNFIPLLMAMDYLQMHIDSDTYEKIVRKELFCTETWNNDIFKLYHFIVQFSSYEYLLPFVCKHLSDHMEKLQDHHEFLSIPFHHFTRIVSKNKFALDEVHGKFSAFNTLSRICAKWISHDLQNRLPHTIDLVNAARSRFYVSNEVPRKDLDLQLSATDQTMNVDLISTMFYQLLTCCGEISGFTRNNVSDKHENETKQDEYFTDDSWSSSDEREIELQPKRRIKEMPKRNFDFSYSYDEDGKQSWSISSAPIYPYSLESKLGVFLKNSNFYDITVKAAGDKMYKLHRCVLKSRSSYFGEILSKEYSELAEKCEMPPTPPSKDKVYFIDEIDSEIFDIVVDHIYLGKIQFTCDAIARLFKAIHVLEIESLKESYHEWMQNHFEAICNGDMFEIINFTGAKDNLKDLNRFFSSKYIANSWPTIENLPQFADFFKAIALPDEKMHSTDKSNSYSFEEVDQETFKLIIEFIYFDEIELNSDSIVRILKAAETFEMEKLVSKCVEWLVEETKTIQAGDTIQDVLEFALRNASYEVLLGVYLAKYVMKWPAIDNSLFCAISFDCLQNMLMSANLCFDDPSNILDICSIWVLHDLENRYRLIPRIACAISRNFPSECDNYCMENPSDLKQCSQDFIKGKFWAVLSSTCVLASIKSSDEAKTQRTEQPAFVMLKHKLLHILTSDWVEIESLRICKDMCDRTYENPYSFTFPMSAAIVDDNLFILYSWRTSCFFHVYNLSSKKLFSLSSDPRFYQTNNSRKQRPQLKYTLLNCRNRIYCCIENGEVFSYVIELNRWMRLCQPDPDEEGLCFASNGNTLYRIHKQQQPGQNSIYYVMKMYDFQQSSWVIAPDITRLVRQRSDLLLERFVEPLDLLYMREYGLALLFEEKLFVHSYNLDGQRTWQDTHMIGLQRIIMTNFEHFILGQNELNEMLYVMNNKLFRYSNFNHRWELRKKIRLRKIKNPSDPDSNTLSQYLKFLPFENMIAIHRPTIR